jgi:hypothetical protein
MPDGMESIILGFFLVVIAAFIFYISLEFPNVFPTSSVQQLFVGSVLVLTIGGSIWSFVNAGLSLF